MAHQAKQNFQGFFKEGTQYFNGADEVLLRNIDACVDLADLTRTSLGPNGMKKIVVNHFDKVYVTGDAATMLSQTEIQHPAAKMLVGASQMQDVQIGDGSNFVLIFAGELLRKATELVRAGISTKDIVAGFQVAMAKALEILPTLKVKDADLSTVDAASKAIITSLTSHQPLDAELLSKLVAECCIASYKKDAEFNTDNVRVAKVLGGGVSDSFAVQGFALQREVCGTVRHVKDCRIAVYATGFDLGDTETKTSTVFTSGEQMKDYARSEENRMEDLVKSIHEKGVNVVICQSKFSEMGVHFLNKYNMMALQLPSQFDIKRCCRAVNAVPLIRVGAPTEDEIGTASLVEVREIGSTPIVVIQREDSPVATVVVRGSTPNVLEDVERSIDDAVNTFSILIRHPELVAGAGASEMELATQIAKWAESRPGMDQYGARKFAEALEVVPKTIAENSGMKIAEFLAKIRSAHNKGQKNCGVDIIGLDIADAVELGVLDSSYVKEWGIKLAVDVANTLLRVDQICMSKPAGGPAPRSMEARDID